MKQVFFKGIAPVGMILLAIGGAFALQSNASSPSSLETGWVDTPSPCAVPVICETTGSIACTAMYQGQLRTVKGKINPNDATCAKALFIRH